ncbi:MAG: acyl carrier protein [Candidatus Kryptoniota bacterium]
MSRNGEDVKEQIRKMLASKMHCSPVILSKDDIDLINELGFDSVKLIEMIVHLEKEFGIEIPENGFFFENIRTLSKLTSFVSNTIDRSHGNGETV